jgi:hypothetical protein
MCKVAAVDIWIVSERETVKEGGREGGREGGGGAGSTAKCLHKQKWGMRAYYLFFSAKLLAKLAYEMKDDLVWWHL